MRIEKTKLYTFDELNEEAKAKAIEIVRGGDIYYDWDEFILEDEKEKLADAGFMGAEISYTVFWSQGDGASFTAQIDLEKWTRGRKLRTKYKKIVELKEDIDANVYKSSSYHDHEYTMSVELSQNYYSNKDVNSELLGELEEIIQEDAREQARIIYRRLQKEYEYLTSDENIAEDLQADKVEFTAGGRPW